MPSGPQPRVKSSPFSAWLPAFAALVLTPAGASAADLSSPSQPSDYNFIDLKWAPWAELGGTYGTEESSYGELGIFAPLAQTSGSLFFTELRGKYFEGNLIEGNAMLGYRKMTGAGFNLGAWAGLDVRHTDSDNTFGQVSGGLEALSQYFDARVNGYYPFSDPQTSNSADVVIEGNNIFMIGGEEVPLYGVDGEVGGRLPLASDNRATLGVYGGGYWFDHDDIDKAITGGYGRVELALNDVVGPGSRLSAQYKYTDDNVRGGRHFVGARLRIPLGPAPAAAEVSPQWLRMADRIERDVDIVVAPSGKEAVEDAMTGVDFEQVVQLTGAADGSDQIGAVTDPNRLIIATGAFTGGQTLNADQTLLGRGTTIQVRGLETGTVAGFTAPGDRPSMAATNAISLTPGGSNIHIAGFDIGGAVGIFSGNSTFNNVVVEQNTITVSNIGINFAGSNDLSILNNDIRGGAGIQIVGVPSENLNLKIIGNQLHDITSRGINAIGDNAIISDNEIYGGQIGIYAQGDGSTISNNYVANVGDGIFAVGSGLTITDNRVVDAYDIAYVLVDAEIVPGGGTGNTYTDTDGTLPPICIGPLSGVHEVTVDGVLRTCPYP